MAVSSGTASTHHCILWGVVGWSYLCKLLIIHKRSVHIVFLIVLISIYLKKEKKKKSIHHIQGGGGGKNVCI